MSFFYNSRPFTFSAVIVVAVMFLTACQPSRQPSILVVYEPGAQISGEIMEVYKVAETMGLMVDSTAFPNDRLSAELWKYRSVVLLLNPNKLESDWQTDIERYVQTGGGLLIKDIPINTYQWPWLADAKSLGVNDYDHGTITFIGDMEDFGVLMNKSLGSEKINKSDLSTIPAPDRSRFTKIVLDADVNEPMELAILPSGKVLFIEREGNFKMFDPATNQTKLLHTFDISTEGNYEDGMLGLAVDPNYQVNNWVYIYYSPYGGKPRQQLSRFVLAYEDSLLVQSEKLIMEVEVQRETCCHSGGSIVFGPGGNLFLSTGDNTSSKESDGYSPLDQRPGRSPFDAQKGTSNADDLRGKILRIKPTEDGSYTIPAGNLFPADGSSGRPEIYAMGCRNPFRFTVDQKTGYVYWGDVGPDSGKDSELGPQSYDEWNQAKTPGYYGWPYFVADNKPYPMLDFASNELGPMQDPLHPVNASPNNTGMQNLPPARTPMIWYPYGESDVWPMLGKGSRSAMGGPMYYRPDKADKTGFPAYFNGKLFIYEWARSWIKVVSFDADWNPTKIESFLPDETFVKPIDMEFDQYGNMYLLEYGANYFANNVEARLVKIEYNEGNRIPVPKIVSGALRGGLPFTTHFSAGNSYDYDGDSLQFLWISSMDVHFEGSEVDFTFLQPGIHTVRLLVTDSQGDTASAITRVIAGNAPPQIELSYSGNQSFYFGNEIHQYHFNVVDAEDGEVAAQTISANEVKVNFSYLERDYDLALLGEEFFQNPQLNLKGKKLIEASDCASCHAQETASIGPSLYQISDRYKSDPKSPALLAMKIIAGGSGNWGHSIMAAHPKLSVDEATQMASYIVGLKKATKVSTLPIQGSITLDLHEKDKWGTYVLSATYTDHGNGDVSSIQASKIIMLKPPIIEAENYHYFQDVQQQRPNGGNFAYVSEINDGSYLGFENIDLTNVGSIDLRIMAFNGGTVYLKQGGPSGSIIASQEIPSPKERSWELYKLDIKKNLGQNDLFVVFENSSKGRYLMNIDQITFAKN